MISYSNRSIRQVDSFEDTTETDMLIFLFRNLLKKDGHDRIVDKTVAQMLEITQAYTANFKVTESVEGKLKTGLQDLRIFEKSSLSSALSRWNEVAEKALNGRHSN